MQTASLSSAGKNLHSTSRKDKELSAHFTQSQKDITASDFKDMPHVSSSLNGPETQHLSLSSKKTDSNMNSLVFKPRDSDAAMFMTQNASLSINSHKQEKDSSAAKQLMSHNSHPSFGGLVTGQTHMKTTIGTDKWSVLFEKCAMRMALKHLHSHLNKITDVF